MNHSSLSVGLLCFFFSGCASRSIIHLFSFGCFGLLLKDIIRLGLVFTVLSTINAMGYDMLEFTRKVASIIMLLMILHA